MSGGAKAALLEAGHDVVWSAEWAEDPGDSAILEMANQQGRVLITLDKDFGDLSVLHGASHCGILRLVNFRASHQGSVCCRVLADHGEELSGGALITAEPGRLRIRRRV